MSTVHILCHSIKSTNSDFCFHFPSSEPNTEENQITRNRRGKWSEIKEADSEENQSSKGNDRGTKRPQHPRQKLDTAARGKEKRQSKEVMDSLIGVQHKCSSAGERR